MSLPNVDVAITNDLERRIAEAFEVFDHGGNKTVDVREVGTIIRSLGCCPSEAEVQEIIVRVEDQETSGSVTLANFLPVVSQIISEFKLQPASPEELLKAFQTLDKEGKGFLEREATARAMMEEGEPFTQEEVDEMMAVAVNPESGNIPYEYYINQIMVRVEPDIYSLVPKKEEVKKKKLGEALLNLLPEIE
ncbi:dynein regulatory complex protein 8-like isoform X1 [Macrosteles quadrilineatus]|uniref:dynein regulatory complex protein 8-like isoform X1 n=1 Tax=Macrosteles quadrilineatus TaxID=74068 RepID=UPI0023E11C64|nr:dynein regulatory complex protein 8-like isoform X1 [Macrosteles quadrilineatus]